MSQRVEAIRRLALEREADGVLVSFLPDVRWAVGFSGSNGLLVVTREAAHFVTDSRYATQARQEVEGAQVHVPGYDLLGFIAEAGLLGAAETMVFQSDHTTVAALDGLRTRIPQVAWTPAEELLVALVAPKDRDEVDRIRRAQAITDAVFAHLLGVVGPGMTEREVAAEVVSEHLRRGAEKMSFDPIVASGPNAALPHARPTDRRLEPGDVLLLDFGCFAGGYASDMTRTVALGEPGEAFREVYEVVLRAQQRAIEAARAGMPSRELDAAARDVIEAAGYGDHFGHSLGHGVGLQTHEWPPVSFRSDAPLPEGAVVTIEPGIYLPGRFGVRIEDLIVLRADGCENLTASTKRLVVL